MKLMSFTTPVLIAALTVVTIGGLGTLAVRSSAVSTQTSIDLLRMNLRVARLHEELLKHSKEDLGAQVETLADRAKHKEEKVSTPPEPVTENAARPWPEMPDEPAER
jgi:hypothetical protein